MQLGILYPFARNHNSIDSIHQEPYSFGDTLLITSYKSIHFRYSILKYIYSLFVENSFGSIWKPIFFNYPEEEFSFNETVIEEEFLIGDSIMIAPILNELN